MIHVYIYICVICLFGIIWYLRLQKTNITEIKKYHIFTFANHKGGVGKTTQIYMLSKYVANYNPNINIILIDGSVYHDLTRLYMGNIYKNVPTLGNLIYKSMKRRKCNVNDIALNMEKHGISAPSNLYIMTNNHEPNLLKNVFHVRNMFNKLSKDKPIIVLCDTDGGMMHELTCFLIAICDSIIVPLSIDTQSIKRMKTLVTFIQSLHTKKINWMKIKMYVYNNLNVIKNIPSDACKVHNLSFTVCKTMIHNIQNVNSYLQTLQNKYPSVFDIKCRHSIRNGGAIVQQSKIISDYKLTTGIESDIQECVKHMFAHIENINA